MTEETDIITLLRILLARRPSESALEDLVKKPLDQTLLRTLAVDEFANNVLEPMLNDGVMLHDKKNIKLTQADLLWISEHIPITAYSKSRLFSVYNWYEVYLILLKDKSLEDALTAFFGQNPKLDRLNKLRADIVSKGRANQQEKPEVVAEIDEATPIDAPEKSKTQTGDEGRKLLDAIELGADYTSVRKALHELYKSGSPGVIWLYRQLVQRESVDASILFLVSYMAVRVYTRQSMYDSAFRISETMLAQEDLVKGLQAADRTRLLKLHALSALRSGRPDYALQMYRRLIVLYPNDWEYYYQLADNIAHTSPQEAIRYFQYALKLSEKMPVPIKISIADFLARQGEEKEAMMLLLDLLKEEFPNNDVYVALANLAHLHGDLWAWRTHLARFFENQRLSADDIRLEHGERMFRFGEFAHDRRTDHAKITVIMTSFNAEKSIYQAVKSVCGQSLGNLEIIVVDDCSEDGTRDIIKTLSEEDSRVRHIFNTLNVGTYCSKNKGIQDATGDYVTFHDSDDWMHPQRLERHLEATIDPYVASMSNWVRMTDEGYAIVRKGGGYTHKNPASTFIRRDVFDNIGLFDCVRTGADTEMLWRIKHFYGHDTVRNIDETLALGLHREDSLTTNGVTAFDEYRYSPVRLQYWESWGNWHFEKLLAGGKIFMPFPNLARDFAAPQEIVVSALE